MFTNISAFDVNSRNRISGSVEDFYIDLDLSNYTNDQLSHVSVT